MSDPFDSTPTDYRQVINKHSRSFSIAASLLPTDLRADVHKLYAWCRWCDDAVDRASSVAAAEQRLQLLRRDIHRIYGGKPVDHGASQWFADLVHKYSIPIEYPLGLLDGMEMDLGDVSVTNEQELILYCHRAAGTVGLMLCRLFGVSDRDALRCADALGIAMQLTNIARDVREDWLVGRCYLPSNWFATTPDRGQLLTNEDVCEPVRRVLSLADIYYRKGLCGLQHLPPSCEISIRVAAKLYREIGEVIRQTGFRVMNGRVSVTSRRKLYLILMELPWLRATALLSRNIRFPTLNRFLDPVPPTVGDVMNNHARYIATLGLSLSSILAAALFGIVAFNPKDAASYGYLPWIYFAGCLVTAIITQLLLNRMDTHNQPVPAAVKVKRQRRHSVD